jgi:hypothetical protein
MNSTRIYTNTHISIDMWFMKSKLGIVRCELANAPLIKRAERRRNEEWK